MGEEDNYMWPVDDDPRLDEHNPTVSSSGLSDLLCALPEKYYICEKKLWCGDIGVDIDHIDNDLNKPLDYKKAAFKMLKRLEKKST